MTYKVFDSSQAEGYVERMKTGKGLGHYINFPLNVYYIGQSRDFDYNDKRHPDARPPRELTGPPVENTYEDEITNMLLKLLEHVAFQFTDHKFCVVNEHLRLRGDIDQWKPTRVFVFEGKQPIGIFWVDYVYERSSYMLCFENSRISSELYRDSSKKTTVYNTAKNIYHRYFYGSSNQEEASEVDSQLSSNVRMAANDKQRVYSAKTQLVKDMFANQLEQKLKGMDTPELMAFIQAMGKTQLLEEAQEAGKELYTVQSVSNAKTCMTIRLLPDDKVLVYEEHKEALTKPKSELGEKVLQVLALLKLTEPKTFIEKAGYKLNDTDYLILKEADLEFDN